MIERPGSTRRRSRPVAPQPKLEDVARAAGVSTASASRALARPELVSVVLREQVLRAAAEQGYVPNASAKALSTRRSSLIGLIVGSMEDPVVRRASEGFGRRLGEVGYGVVLAISDGDAEESLRVCGGLLAHGVEALALVGVDVPNDLGTRLGKAPPLLVCLDRRNPDGRTAGFSREQALELALRYLRELGHRRIGVVEPSRGYRRLASDDPSVRTDSTLVRLELAGEGALRGHLGQSLKAWLSASSPPSALICGSDAIAAAILSACEELGVEIPDRLSVIGLGDSQLAHWTRPKLSTLRVPAFEGGAAAADALLGALRGHAYDRPELTAKLVIRGSTGSPL